MSQNPFDQQKPIPGVKHVIAVASGKGGVGKSTVATNLALTLKKKGASVGLLDADIYGPSIPRMLGALRQKPDVDQDQQILPLERQGLKVMSMGFLVEEGLAVVWRGPMLFKSMDQFLFGVKWGELDYLLVDLPPGTGDVQLTLAQKVPVSGAVCVSTPQNVALVDVKKAIDMMKRLNIPVLGLVENMSYFLPPGSDEKVSLFPKGEIDKYLDSERIPKLTEVPFNQAVALAGESGIPYVAGNDEDAVTNAFLSVAEVIKAKLQ